MAEIRLTPETARERATEIGDTNNQLQDLVSTLERIIDVNLAEEWAGQAQVKFSDQFGEIKSGPLKKLEELLEDLSAQLNSIADVMEETDANIASQIGLQ